MRSASLLASLALLIAVGGLLAQDPKTKPAEPPKPADPKTKPAEPPKPADPKTAPAAVAVSDYFPAKKGTKWTYKYAEADVIMEIKDVSGADVKIDTLSNNKAVAAETLELKADGIYRTKINDLPITPPLKILELESKGGKLVPKAKGTKWKVDSKVQQSALKGEYEIGETAKVMLPAPLGDVDATKVTATLDIAGTQTNVTYWFAPNKGQVKVSYTIAGNTQEMNLKAFEAGK